MKPIIALLTMAVTIGASPTSIHIDIDIPTSGTAPKAFSKNGPFCVPYYGNICAKRDLAYDCCNNMQCLDVGAGIKKCLNPGDASTVLASPDLRQPLTDNGPRCVLFYGECDANECCAGLQCLDNDIGVKICLGPDDTPDGPAVNVLYHASSEQCNPFYGDECVAGDANNDYCAPLQCLDDGDGEGVSRCMQPDAGDDWMNDVNGGGRKVRVYSHLA